jgi:hypothetical protein
MKQLKMFGFVALAVLMAMAFTSTSAAMAESTSFCSVDESPCAAGHQVGHLHGVTGGGPNMAVLSSVGTTECEVLYLASANTTLANPLVLSGSFTYSNCKLGGSSCTVTEENGPNEITALKEGHETAKAVLEFLMHVTCPGFIDCSYVGAGMKGIFKGALLPFTEGEEFEAGTLVKEAGGFLCPKTSKLDLLVLSLETIYIAS